MNIEKIIKKYYYANQEIEEVNKKIKEYIELQNETRNTLKANVITDMPRGTGTSNNVLDAIEKIIDNLDTKIEKLADQLNELINTKYRIDTAISELTDLEKQLVYLRYSECLAIKQICYTLKYSRAEIYRMLDCIKSKLDVKESA